MSSKIYKVLQDIIPELRHLIPTENDDFESFSAWINRENEIFHYVELTEYFDNGIEDDFFFKRFHVNTAQLQSEIEEEIAVLFDQFNQDVDANAQDNFDAQTESIEQTEIILFDKIKSAASEHKLSLLVVYRENPYWLLVPTMDEDKLNEIVDEFNHAFNQDGDLNMAIY